MYKLKFFEIFQPLWMKSRLLFDFFFNDVLGRWKIEIFLNNALGGWKIEIFSNIALGRWNIEKFFEYWARRMKNWNFLNNASIFKNLIRFMSFLLIAFLQFCRMIFLTLFQTLFLTWFLTIFLKTIFTLFLMLFSIFSTHFYTFLLPRFLALFLKTILTLFWMLFSTIYVWYIKAPSVNLLFFRHFTIYYFDCPDYGPTFQFIFVWPLNRHEFFLPRFSP